jgi:2-amino-4-hydroxy-6-hydroxymethyldihydropteridine diphosphokinase
VSRIVQRPESNSEKSRAGVRSPRTAEIQLGNLAFIALGANLGEAKANILHAMDRLQEFSRQRLLKSSLWQTAPVDCPPGSPFFFNAAVGLVPQFEETPESLLAKLQAIEKEFGRQPKKDLNEARPLDLDLIAFGSQRRETKDLVLPHPRAHVRQFVLAPLAEIEPGLILPGQMESVAQLLAKLREVEGALAAVVGV